MTMAIITMAGGISISINNIHSVYVVSLFTKESTGWIEYNRALYRTFEHALRVARAWARVIEN